MASNLALNRCGTVESKMPIKMTIFLVIHHNKITSLAERLLQKHPRKQSHCNNQTIAKELTLVSSVQAKQYFKTCLVSALLPLQQDGGRLLRSR